jgi:hypothetical protein
MNLDAEIDVSVDAVAPMAMKFGAVGGGAESERAHQRAARALQTIPNWCETGDDRLDDDHVVIGVGVIVDGDRPSRRELQRIALPLQRRDAAICDGARSCL